MPHNCRPFYLSRPVGSKIVFEFPLSDAGITVMRRKRKCLCGQAQCTLAQAPRPKATVR